MTLRVEWWPRSQFPDLPPAIVLRGKGWKTVIEFGRTSWLPLFCRQVLRTRFLSVWVDEDGTQ
jgi:hypothetical protein